MPETSASQHALARRVARALLAALAALALALGVLPATATTASASAPIDVSVDGEHWAPELPRQLFDSVDRLSPGDRVEDAVWLRNATAAPIAVRVQMRWIGPADTAAIDDVLAVGMNGSSATVRQLRAEPLTVDLGKLAPQATARLDAEAVLPFSAPNATQSRYLDLDLVLQLSGDDDPGPVSQSRPRPPRPPRRDLKATPRTASAACRAMTRPTAGHRCRAPERRRYCSWWQGWRRSASGSLRCSRPAVGAAMRKQAPPSAETQLFRLLNPSHFPSWKVIDTLTSGAEDDR